MARVPAHDPLAHSRFRPSGEPPFGVIREDEGTDVEGYFDKVFARVKSGGRRLEDRLKDILDAFLAGLHYR